MNLESRDDMKILIEEIIKEIEAYDVIIIHRHARPDPDALGSQLGLKKLLEKSYPGKQIFAVGEMEESLEFLGRMDEISDEVYTNALVCVLDTANEERISDQRYKLGKSVVKIDHHPPVENYGQVNWVETKASSTSEMIVALIQASPLFKDALDREIALPLYAGIVGDTGRFMHNNTTGRTFEAASLLIDTGIDTIQFYRQLHRKSLKATRLEGYVLSNFTFYEEDGVGEMRLSKETLKQFDMTPNESSLLVNIFSSVEGLKAWVFFVEDEDRIRVRLRSKGPVINELAAKFNGGGHPLASGATVYSFTEADELLEQLRELSRTHI